MEQTFLLLDRLCHCGRLQIKRMDRNRPDSLRFLRKKHKKLGEPGVFEKATGAFLPGRSASQAGRKRGKISKNRVWAHWTQSFQWGPMTSCLHEPFLVFMLPWRARTKRSKLLSPAGREGEDSQKFPASILSHLCAWGVLRRIPRAWGVSWWAGLGGRGILLIWPGTASRPGSRAHQRRGHVWWNSFHSEGLPPLLLAPHQSSRLAVSSQQVERRWDQSFSGGKQLMLCWAAG